MGIRISLASDSFVWFVTKRKNLSIFSRILKYYQYQSPPSFCTKLIVLLFTIMAVVVRFDVLWKLGMTCYLIMYKLTHVWFFTGVQVPLSEYYQIMKKSEMKIQKLLQQGWNCPPFMKALYMQCEWHWKWLGKRGSLCYHRDFRRCIEVFDAILIINS